MVLLACGLLQVEQRYIVYSIIRLSWLPAKNWGVGGVAAEREIRKKSETKGRTKIVGLL